MHICQMQADRRRGDNGGSSIQQDSATNQQLRQPPVNSDAEAAAGSAAESESEVLPAESAIMQDPEVSADQGGTEFDAKAADVQTPVGAQG